MTKKKMAYGQYQCRSTYRCCPVQFLVSGVDHWNSNNIKRHFVVVSGTWKIIIILNYYNNFFLCKDNRRVWHIKTIFVETVIFICTVHIVTYCCGRYLLRTYYFEFVFCLYLKLNPYLGTPNIIYYYIHI